MTTINRRDCAKGLLGLAALSQVPAPLGLAQESAIPPQGIGKRFRHLSYSDLGGRPDSVQVMLNRRHLYVGHMFSNGVTILDAADPRNLKPVGFFTGGDFTRTHHLQVSDDLLLLANGANIVAMQSYTDIRGYFENALADSITNRKKFRSGLSIHDISRPAEMREIAFLEMAKYETRAGTRMVRRKGEAEGATRSVASRVDRGCCPPTVGRRRNAHRSVPDNCAPLSAAIPRVPWRRPDRW